VAAVAVVIIIPICNEMLCFVAFFFSRAGFGTKPAQKEAFKRFCLKKHGTHYFKTCNVQSA